MRTALLLVSLVTALQSPELSERVSETLWSWQ